ncbi:hypothetical protein NL108_004684 [Boleophthalmus pectinirostris]|nr:hypothetical protein NL108_004684 [Boleophthalmus pectinirostris]
MSLSLASLNARGLKNATKRKALFLFAKTLNTDFFFFQESHSTSHDTNFWRSHWGDNVFPSHGTQHSTGTLTVKHKFEGDILSHKCDNQGHFVFMVLAYQNKTFIVINIYGYNSKRENYQLLSTLENHIIHVLNQFPNAIIIIGGDFNMVLINELDRWPPQTNSSNNPLVLFMRRFSLKDFWTEKFQTASFYMEQVIVAQSSLDSTTGWCLIV